MEANPAVSPAEMASDDKLCEITTTAQTYYDSDELYHYHRHVRNRAYTMAAENSRGILQFPKRQKHRRCTSLSHASTRSS